MGTMSFGSKKCMLSLWAGAIRVANWEVDEGLVLLIVGVLLLIRLEGLTIAGVRSAVELLITMVAIVAFLTMIELFAPLVGRRIFCTDLTNTLATPNSRLGLSPLIANYTFKTLSLCMKLPVMRSMMAYLELLKAEQGVVPLLVRLAPVIVNILTPLMRTPIDY